MSEAGFGYPHMMTLAMGVPWSGRPLPPELPMAFKQCAPSMNTNCVMLETRGRPIDQARNFFAEKALALNAKYLFFWDEDVLLPPHALRELIFLMENWPSIGVAAGIYCLKVNEHPEPLVFKGTGHGVYWDWKVGEVFEATGVGMGCSLIRTEVFKDLEKPWFKTVDNYEPYMDNLPFGEQWTEDLFFCVVSSTNSIVYGDQLPIEQCSLGTEVMSHTGLIRPVLDTNVREYTGEVMKIHPQYGGEFSVTPGHPVEVERSGKREFVSAETLNEDDYLIVPIPKWRIREDRPDTLPAWNIIRGKHLEFKDGKFRYRRTHKDNQWFPLMPAISADLCALCGYWVAEGSTGDGSVSWTFNINEVEYADDVQMLLRNVFNLASVQNVYEERHLRVVVCCSTALGDWLNHYFGKKSAGRKLPEEILMGSPSQISAFLKAYWRGDGDKNKVFGLHTASVALAHDLRFILLRLGIYAGVQRKQWKDYHSYRLHIPTQFLSEWLAKLGLSPKQSTPRPRSVERRDDYFAVPIERIEKVSYHGPVYNLKVATDETFNVGGFSVHNCRKVVDQKKWKIVAHGGLVMPHLDVRTGKYFELPPDSKPAKHLSLPVGKKKILDIGAGPNPLKTNEGKVITCDIRGDVGADYRCDVRRLPFATEEFDVVYSSHCLEHLPRAQTSATLDEWIRVLKPDGELRIIVPNIQWAAKRVLADDFSVENSVGALDVLYGQQAYDEDRHMNGFTPKSLEALVRSKGFKHFDIQTPSFHIVLKAWRKKPKANGKTK